MLFVAATVSVVALVLPALKVTYKTAKNNIAIMPHITILRSIFVFPPYNDFSFYYKTLKISNPIIINIIITVNQDTFLFSGLS